MDVFDYLDPYLILQHYYQSRKKYEPEFSYNKWSEELGLKSSSTLRMMVNGKKRLSPRLAEKFVESQFQQADEKNYFRLLVLYAHATTPYARASTWTSLAKILAGRVQQREALDYFTYVSDLHCPKIMTLLSFNDQQWSEKKLSLTLNVEPNIIKETLKKLDTAEMIYSESSAAGEVFWKAQNRLIKVSDKLGDVALRAYHNASLDEAKAAQSFSVEVRRYKSLLLPLDEKEFHTLTEELNSFAKQLILRYQSDQYQGRKLFKLNFNYFPVTESLG